MHTRQRTIRRVISWLALALSLSGFGISAHAERRAEMPASCCAQDKSACRCQAENCVSAAHARSAETGLAGCSCNLKPASQDTPLPATLPFTLLALALPPVRPFWTVTVKEGTALSAFADSTGPHHEGFVPSSPRAPPFQG